MSSDYSAYPGYPGAGAYSPYSSPASGATTAVDPIISRLRRRDVVGIIDQSFRIYRKHFLTFLAIIAIFEVPLQALIQLSNVLLIGSTSSLYSTNYYNFETSPSTVNDRFTSIFVYRGAVYGLLIVYYVLMSFPQAALTAAVADNYLDRPVSFAQAYRQTFRRAGPVLGLMLLELLIIVGALLPAILILGIMVGALASSSTSDAGGASALVCLAFPLMLIGGIFVVYAIVRLQAALPALVVENLSPVQAVRRSWRLLYGYWWRTAGLLLILYILNMVVASGPAALITSITTLVVRMNPVTTQAITGAITVLTTAVFIPVQLTAYTLYYFDTRVRKEGFDLEAAIAQAYPNPFPGGQNPYYPQPGQAYGYPTNAYGGQYSQAQYATPAYTQPLGYSGSGPQPARAEEIYEAKQVPEQHADADASTEQADSEQQIEEAGNASNDAGEEPKV